MISGSENHPHTPKLKLCSPHRTDAGRTELHSVGTLPQCHPAHAWTHRCQHRSSSFLPAMRSFMQNRLLVMWQESKTRNSSADMKKSIPGETFRSCFSKQKSEPGKVACSDSAQENPRHSVLGKNSLKVLKGTFPPICRVPIPHLLYQRVTIFL